MTIRQASVKIDLRLNKSASGDYDNIWPYVKEEAFNKSIYEWVRRQKHGKNQTQEGDEESDVRVDDLQVLLKSSNLSFRKKDIYVQSEAIPTDYLYFKRLTPYVSKDACKSVLIRSSLREEANVDTLLDVPSFQFEETFHTINGNRIHLYHNNDFNVDRLSLTYYRKPKQYSFKKLDQVIEFKDDVCDIIIDNACNIIASDIESLNAAAITKARLEENN